MIEHGFATPTPPARVVVLGAKGFVGSAVTGLLGSRGIPVLGIARDAVNFSMDGAAERLAALFRPDDAVLFIAARAPCKDAGMLQDNIRIGRTVCEALERRPVVHVVYISSDAVYKDSPQPLTEGSCAEPGSLHGVMHLAREVILRSSVKAPLALLRPTLIYGATDPHNGYGPNRFRRLAAAGQDIVLFGEGEERRDHILVDDVAELTVRILSHRSAGTLNLATGEVHSFRALAERIVAMSGKAVAVKGSPRKGPMPHDGYRPFDVAAVRHAFPDFAFTPLDKGLTIAAQPIRPRQGISLPTADF